VKADGVNCSDCGWIPFNLLDQPDPADEDKEDFLPVREMVAHFRLNKILGKGGFGSVWLAEDINLGREVALKVPVASRESVSMLLHEAQSAAKLRHPNIVAVYETGTSADGQAFIASEYIEGLNLRDVLSAGRPTHKTTVNLLITLTDALFHAHQAGVIHRDIKPANVIIDAKGNPYLADFGLAKQVSAEQSISSEGQILGTASYMSPEQATGQSRWTDHRTDIYSIGVVLFEMLTGHLPFRGNVRAVIHQKMMQDAPSPRSLDLAVPKDLETICLKCLERDPEKRFPTAMLLKEELERVRRGEPILSRPVSSVEKMIRWARRYPLITGLSGGFAATLIIGLIVVTILWKSAAFNAERARNSLYRSMMTLASQQFGQGDIRSIRKTLERVSDDPELDELKDFAWHYYDALMDSFPINVVHGDEVTAIGLSRDGQFLGTVGREGQLAVWNGRTSELIQRISPVKGRYTSVDFSPTRLHLAAGATNGFISFWNPSEMDLPLKQIKHGPPVIGVRYSPNGKYVLSFGAQGAVRIWDVETEEVVAEIPSGPFGSTSAAFSPDNTRIAVGGNEGLVRLWIIEGRRKELEIPNGSNGTNAITSVSFSGDGSRLIVASENGTYRIFSTATGEELVEHYTYQGKLGGAMFLPGDELVVCTGTVQSMDLYDVEKSQRIATYPTHRLGVGVFSLSSDGRFLAIGSGDGTANVVSTSKIQQPQMYWHTGPIRCLAFSDDGMSVYSLGQGGEVIRQHLGRRESSTVLEKGEEESRMFVLTPDHQHIVRAVPRPDITFCRLVNSNEGVREPQVLTVPQNAIHAVHAPRGQQSLYVVSRTGTLFDYELSSPPLLRKEMTLKGDEVVATACTRDRLAVSFESGKTFVVELPSLKIERELNLANAPSALGFCGDHLLAGTSSGGIEAFNLLAEVLKPQYIEGHGARITAIECFPHQKTFVSASRDRQLKIWDLKSGEAITTLQGHRRQIFSLAVSPDGRTIASGGLEGDILIWRSRAK